MANSDDLSVIAEIDVNFEDCVRVDEDVLCKKALSDNDIIASVC